MRIDKILVLTKFWRLRGSISLLFGLAESTAADFSQTSLMFSYVSQKVLIPPHAVAKCAVATGRPAFMGGLSHALLYQPAMQKTSQILVLTNIGARQDFTDFCKTICSPIKNW
jgi:hypothetical protein